MVVDVATAFGSLHVSFEHAKLIEPDESHNLFGAGFILLGSLLVAEAVAGGVWHRSLARTLIFPGTLVALGLGMLAVTAVEPNARLAHLAMGTPLAIGGWAEARVRLAGMKRQYADMFIVPGLLFAALETAAFHLDGTANAGNFATHAAIVVAGVVIAGLRLYQSGEPTSVRRSLVVSAVVMIVGLVLFVDSLFQTSAT
jgi:hypothetical protein